MQEQKASNPTTDFAHQLRVERLAILWKAAAVLAAIGLWAGLVMSISASLQSMVEVVLATGSVIGGGFLTGRLLSRDRYHRAVWVFVLSLYFAISILIYGQARTNDPNAVLYTFAIPCIVLIVTLLLPLREASWGVLIGLAITVIVPSLGKLLTISTVQLVSIGLSLLIAGVAVQFSGEIYSIAEWAMAGYQKERKFKEQLFDSQQEIQRGYMRQKALADELKAANAALDAARAAAEEAKNFRGQFLANMSHELRTPLNAIIGFSETMLRYPIMYNNQPLPDAYRQDITQIHNSGKHLLQLINDVLDLARVDAGKLEIDIERVALESIFTSTLATANSLVGAKPIQLRRDVPAEGLPDVAGDPLRIQQAILNLLGNAIKFTESGTVTLGARPEDDHVLLWVADTGIGISEQDLPLIFEEFRQGASGRKQGRAGSGLGLAITRHLITLMNGKIWAESTLGKGSTFYFTLPIAQPVATEVEAEGQKG